ncbi:MAG: tannase/feruloyl esterase family alpha/beta hydrolase [Acidobacteriota bacterium]|nr:tannase/feruloyl esterase family alpha/beta hydrolase [Acidobacteriota bacterium]
MLKYVVRWISIAAACCLIAAIPAAAASCESLASLKLPDGKITSAAVVAAGAFTPPGAGGPLAGGPGGSAVFKAAPAFCRVAATLTPSPDSDIKIEVWMPVEKWNGKLVGIGNGVWAGSISHSAMAEPLAKGYATVATDAGHTGNGMSGAFAAGHPEKLIDFGYRAVHEMTVKAKTFIEAFYGRKEQRSLWVSCSTGGRQGLMASYRYPDDFDGISSMAPANPMVGLMISTMWANYAATKEADRRLAMPQLMAANRAYIARCDEKDGVKDGIVSDPERCDFDPAGIQCGDGASGDCLTAAQAAALRDIYGYVKNARTGEKIFAGFEPGSEQMLMMLTSGDEPFPVATSYFRDLVFADPKWDFKAFDYDKDIEAARKFGSAIIDVPPDGPVKFLEKGGKLLLSHGWADGLIPARNTIDFYQSLTANLKAEKLKDSVQLFMMPGVGHCSGGDGPSVVDLLSELDNWVETGKKPERIIAARPAMPGKPAAKTAQPQPAAQPMTRPLCPWPQAAVYKGSGSTDDAANFECRAK